MGYNGIQPARRNRMTPTGEMKEERGGIKAFHASMGRPGAEYRVS
jgi:hypothetical protein